MGGKRTFEKALQPMTADYARRPKEDEPHAAIVSNAVSEFAVPYRKVMFLDVHTGFGEKGVVHSE